MDRTFKILSIDGGGIRGIIPALVLTEIERRTGRPISKLFDLIAGTSTGGIIALGLTRPGEAGQPRYRAEQIVDLYLREGKRIFSRSLWHRIRSAEGLLEEKYQAGEVEKVLDEYFGETRLSEALTNVFVTSYEIELRSPWFFRSARPDEPGRDFPMKKVARATSAAPTYFEPAKLEKSGDPGYWALVDGGVYANNPTLCGLVEARVAFGADDVFVVSLGTGERTRRIPYAKAKGWGVAGWARPVLDVVFDGVSDTVHFQAQQLCGTVSGKRRYYRYQVELAAAREEWVDDWDDASETNLDRLRELTKRMIEKRSAELDEMCAALTEAQSAAGVT